MCGLGCGTGAGEKEHGMDCTRPVYGVMSVSIMGCINMQHDTCYIIVETSHGMILYTACQMLRV